MKVFAPLFFAAVLVAAEPDWTRLEKSALELLQQYIRIQSINPPANTVEAATLVKGLLERDGILVSVFAAVRRPDHLLARLPGRDRTRKPLLLLNHLDVVPVDRSAWKMDPFAAVIQDGRSGDAARST